MRPADIEAESFRIIDREAGPHSFTPEQWQIVRRMIHTSADFDYLKTVRFHPRAVAAGIAALLAGKPVITDTNMACTGIRKKDAGRLDVKVGCHMDDPAVHVAAASSGTTRAVAAVDVAASEMTDGIYVVGNAPTALLRLIEHVGSGRARPALIVGLPVGFVNAAESKSALAELDHPHITNVGRKGGSNLAAAVVNALLLLALEKNKA
ncbi:MAG TPA: precorrin-8X methylmutase [Desulfobacterales bacterium]|nr:precorrin-8X methylmutase [Desulfobacterales bacterium]